MDETISAIATAPGAAGVGIIRLSGKDSIEIANKIFSGKSLTEVGDKALVYGHIKNAEGNIIDEVIALVMRAPKSYTRENVVELQCHGGSVVLREVLKLTYMAGARPAERGEFTKRAFLNGRIDLTQAQAVLDVIQAKTSAALTVSQNQLAGTTSRTIKEIRRAIINSAAHIEATIDFPEDDLDDVVIGEVNQNISSQIAKLEELMTNQAKGKILREGLETAIIGKPNVGKSSLLNFFAKTERAIVTDIPGTTRDSIEEYVNVGGIPLKIIDTAGIRNSVNTVEQIGIERAKDYAARAELILALFDGSRELDDEDEEIFKLLTNRNVLILLTKIDLNKVTTVNRLKKKFPAAQIIEVSLKKGTGTDKLLKAIENKVGNIDFEMSFVRDEREADLLRRIVKHLRDAQLTIKNNFAIDFVSIDLHAALDCLSELTGESVSEDILNEIFSKFCIGK
ncbi:MAG: tRNA uridine-5-carboxymethylaminomethyl(34) synthesis GTPase MnmE [Selenomonadaceae bacterium]|nr:tRNA uridine-5-carboxymethylaminomethyl(34) synthesis GTPase MnmE [Selenomonadaceae bacterium]